MDKLLQAAGIVKRRTRAQELCRQGYVSLDGRPAKAGKQVKVGQQVTVQLGRRVLVFEVCQIPGAVVPKQQRDDVVRLLETRTIQDDL